MSNRREEIRKMVKARAAARNKTSRLVVPKPARKLNTTKIQQAHRKRQQLKVRQDRVRQKARSQGSARSGTALNSELQRRLQRVQGDYDQLQDDLLLTSIHDDMGRLEATLTGLATDLEILRTNGYAFRSYLENKINVLTDKWEQISEHVDDELGELSDELEQEADEVEKLVRRAYSGNSATIGRAESAVNSLDRKISAARQALRHRYEDVAQTIRQTRSQLDEVQWAFTQAGEAQFNFLEAEFLVAACQAKFLADPDDEDEAAEGVLYLTDERLIFEQKEKVATKKILFFTTESETIQEVDFETLLDWIEAAEIEDKRKLLSKKEILNLKLSPEAGPYSATFRLLKGARNEVWAQLINRARSGEIERERIAEAAAEKVLLSEKVSEAPVTCSMCGASLPSTLARGQSEITCEYCGTVVRL